MNESDLSNDLGVARDDEGGMSTFCVCGRVACECEDVVVILCVCVCVGYINGGRLCEEKWARWLVGWCWLIVGLLAPNRSDEFQFGGWLVLDSSSLVHRDRIYSGKEQRVTPTHVITWILALPPVIYRRSEPPSPSSPQPKVCFSRK